MYCRSSKFARSIDSSRFSDARGPSGASQSLMQVVSDDWNEWQQRLAAALYTSNLVSAQFRRSITGVELRLFLGRH